MLNRRKVKAMRKLLTILAMSLTVLVTPTPANAAETDILQKGDVIVQDFGELVDLTELRDALKTNNISANRIALSGRAIYIIQLAYYNGDRYKLKIDRRTGEIIWLAKRDLGVILID